LQNEFLCDEKFVLKNSSSITNAFTACQTPALFYKSQPHNQEEEIVPASLAKNCKMISRTKKIRNGFKKSVKEKTPKK
jgi:hypothetical protein